MGPHPAHPIPLLVAIALFAALAVSPLAGAAAGHGGIALHRDAVEAHVAHEGGVTVNETARVPFPVENPVHDEVAPVAQAANEALWMALSLANGALFDAAGAANDALFAAARELNDLLWRTVTTVNAAVSFLLRLLPP